MVREISLTNNILIISGRKSDEEKEVYRIGASLKDLGKKWFAFSKMSGESLGLLGKLV